MKKSKEKVKKKKKANPNQRNKVMEKILPALNYKQETNDDLTDPNVAAAVLDNAKINAMTQIKTMDDITQFVFAVVDQMTLDASNTPKKALDVPQEYIDSLYGFAYNFYSTGQYSDATNIFRLLIMIDRTNYDYLFGLAASLQMEEEFQAAATTYLMASAQQPDNPMPHFHAAECFMKQKEIPSTCISLDLAIRSAGNQKKHEQLKLRCQITKEELIKRLKAKKLKKKMALKKLLKKKRKKEAEAKKNKEATS